MTDGEDSNESYIKQQEECKIFLENQGEKWKSLISKFSADTSNYNVLEISLDEITEFDENLMDNVIHKTNMNKSEDDIEHFEAWMNKPECVTNENLFLSLQQYLKNYLKVDIESYYVKVVTSFIKGDENLSRLKLKFLKKMQFIKKYLEQKYLIYYLEQCFPPVPSNIIVDIIEKEHKSNLRLYFEMREKQCVSKEIYYDLINNEWNRLEKKIPVNFLFRFYTHLYGNITWALMNQQ